MPKPLPNHPQNYFGIYFGDNIAVLNNSFTFTGVSLWVFEYLFQILSKM